MCSSVKHDIANLEKIKKSDENLAMRGISPMRNIQVYFVFGSCLNRIEQV